MSHPSDTLAVMRKTPLYQGKEQPLKNRVVDAAANASRGSQDHGQQSAGGASSNDRPTARPPDRRLGPQGAGGVSNGARPADAGGNGRRGVDVDRRTSPSASVLVGAAGDFRGTDEVHAEVVGLGSVSVGDAGSERRVGGCSCGGRIRQEAAGARPSVVDARPPVSGGLPSAPGGFSSSGVWVSRCSAEVLPSVFGVDAADLALEVLGRVSAEQMTTDELERLSTTLGRIRSRTSDLLRSVAAVALKDRDKGKGKGGKGVDAVHLLGGRAKLGNREIRRLKRVAERLEEMPNTSERLQSGVITFEHAAALADAGAECGAESVDNDEDLLKSAERTPIDQYYKQTRSFAGRHAPDRGRARLKWQRRRRQASLYTEDDTGMGVIRALFDPISFNLLRQSVDRHTDALWREDGGRDGQPNSRRTPQQRCCDAIFELLTGKPAPAHKPDTDDSSRRPPGGRSNQREQGGRSNRQAPVGRPDRRGQGGRSNQREQGGRSNRQAPVGGSSRRPQAGHSDRRGQGGRSDRRTQGGRSDRQAPVGGSSRRPQAGHSDRRGQGERSDQWPPAGRSDRRPQGERSDRRPPAGRSDRRPQGERSDRRPPAGRSDRRPQGERSDRRPPAGRSDRRPQGGRSARRPNAESPDLQQKPEHPDRRPNAEHPDRQAADDNRGLDDLSLMSGNWSPAPGEHAPNNGGREGERKWVKAKDAAQLVVIADIGVLDGTNLDGRCEILGTGPVPPDILSELSPDTELSSIIFGGNGQPLWLRRSRRLANDHQRLAVAIRDGGCVLCEAPMHLCEIHHVQEWNTQGGATDVENLAAICGHHHRWLHNNNQQLTYSPENGNWTTQSRPPPPSPPSPPPRPPPGASSQR